MIMRNISERVHNPNEELKLEDNSNLTGLQLQLANKE